MTCSLVLGVCSKHLKSRLGIWSLDLEYQLESGLGSSTWVQTLSPECRVRAQTWSLDFKSELGVKSQHLKSIVWTLELLSRHGDRSLGVQTWSLESGVGIWSPQLESPGG